MATRERTERLPPEIFELPVEKMREGYYTDAYFNHTRETLLADGRHPRVVMQVFQRNAVLLGGIDEALAKPGHELQHRYATAEPTAEQLEVAEAALAACLELEHGDRAAS